ncbi:PD40 domain-containing protein [Campylobacter sp. RM12642]|uniref:Tol-Pal system protein TolB n=1 Tax=Campylobacter sp. RM12642 TaxID=2735736 RepID=UPI0030147D43|nr:PD40 domain-containing protein [Campylobacter sp. RM12642]
MKKIFLLCFSLVCLTADIIMDVVSEQEVLPKIRITTSSLVNFDFDKVIKNDVLVSSKFEITNENNANYELNYNLNPVGNNYELSITLKGMNNEIKYNNTFTYPKSAYVFLSHKAISQMFKDLKLADLDWMNKKILITRKIAAKQSQILIADYTLNYQKIIMQGGLNLFAKWANSNQNEFYYTDYNKDILSIYKYNLLNNQKTLITQGSGMLALSDISKDGTKALITKTIEDQPEIFLLDLNTKNTKRLTMYKGIDVSARFVGSDSFAFVSDRSSYPNLYLQGLDKTNATQLVYHGKNNSAFSVYNNYIVYSSREKSGDFNLYVMATDSQYVRQLTLNGRNIFPNFSSDGKTIMFIKLLGMQSSLGILRLDENKVYHFPLKVGKISTLDW